MSIVLGNPMALSGKKKSKGLDFTYTGDYTEREDGVVELRSSGAITFNTDAVIDVFMVGGGGAGSTPYADGSYGSGGGGGGYTRTVRQLSVAASSPYTVAIGAGGVSSSGRYTSSGSSAFGENLIAAGGENGFYQNPNTAGHDAYDIYGAKGGSGGGGGVISNSDYGSGGSDGNDGETGYSSSNLYTKKGGAGQGFTTREFGEATGKLYAGGGGGGRYMSGTTAVVSPGGAGGGGAGAWQGAGYGVSQAAVAGGANTGGGGGGGAQYSSSSYKVNGASGGSGIVCFREAQELPELAGTWVLNEILYQPLTNIQWAGTAIIENADGTSWNVYNVFYQYETLHFSISTSQSDDIVSYNFKNKQWSASANAVKRFTINSTDAVTDDFRAWLASNATKQ